MRVTTDDITRTGPVRVFLDGELQPHVVMADDAMGIVERCVLDADGNPQVNPYSSGKVWTETVAGVVRIEREL